MRKLISILSIAVSCGMMIMLGSCIFAGDVAKNIEQKDCFFLSSLHHTADGMGYWYSKENGGFEKLTGIAYDDLTCKNCHTACCDDCHKVDKEGRFSYSTQNAKNEKLCLNCHSRQMTMLFKIDKPRGELDVHFAQGMECMDCHTAREMHGDGKTYPSMLHAGAMDVKCENCHQDIPVNISHNTHRKDLDCSACHTRRVITCYNCHFETQVKEDKKVSIPTTDWVFLINRDGKVTSGNFQSLVYKGKTFVAFAPFFSHSIMKKGRACSECHGTEIISKMDRDKLRLTWFENGELKSAKGIIPIVEGKLDFLFLDYKEGKWVRIENASAPEIQFTPYGTPITQEQFRKLTKKKSK